MNPSLYIAFFSGILNLSIGIYLLLKNPKSNINRLFLLIVMSIIIFNIGEFFTRLSITAEEALFWGRISYAVLWLCPCFALHFSMIFPRKIIPPRYISIAKYSIICTYVIGLIIYIFFIYTTSSQNILATEWGYRVVLTASSSFIIIWFLIIFGLVIINLAYKFFRGNLYRIEKKQIKIIWTGATLLVVIGFMTNLLPPLLNFKMFPMTSLFTSIFIFFVAYAIIRYKFLSLSPAIIAENILHTMNDLVIIVNEKGDIVNVNNSTLKLLGYEKKELMNYSLNQIVKLPEGEERDGKKVFESKPFEKLYANKVLEDIEVEFVSKAGKTTSMSVSTSAMYDNDRNLDGIVLVARDLTEIKKSLKEKEVLLREIHHRVKNNLQLINSLLDLQSEQIENKDVVEIFRESQNRIKLMASLHEQLYQSKDLAKINFDEYIQDLITNLFHSYKINPDTITLKINARGIFMNVDTTLACSLMINELVSNSLKHAFPSGRKGEVIVDFNLDGDTYKLVVGDNGVGFPEELDFRNTKTLGLQLVNIFVQQLKGNIKLDRTSGTKFIITFEYIRQKKKGL
ncbi:MAG: PAS domain S-box protein [Thermoplasmatales archaeon]|nr:MAG: PAS domain S-box protein [Thermoplasmatales archaeon]